MLAAHRLAGCYVQQMKPIEVVRRENLLELAADEGGQAALARRIGKDKNQVNQWLGRAGSRNMSGETAREIEQQLGKPAGWLDHDRSTLRVQDADTAPYSASQPLGFSDKTMTQAVELLHLLGGARPDDPRFRRITWASIKVAAKIVNRYSNGDAKDAMAQIVSEMPQVEADVT